MPKRSALSVSILVLAIVSLVLNSANSATLQCLPCLREPKPTASFEEFEFEHQVTKQEAINALNQLNDTYHDAPRESGCKAISCTQKTMKYCLGAQFLNDHCWCEQGHGEEGLPFVPHTCYVGDKVYGASAGSCYIYTQLKKCCCMRALAKQWKYLSSSQKLEESKLISIWLPIGISLVFYYTTAGLL